MEYSFNLLTEPWIPVVDQAGEIRELGIAETLLYAHELAGISDPAPPVQFGIYRLLIAFVMDAFEIMELEQIEELINLGLFDIETINLYIKSCGANVFNIFDEHTPFYQFVEARNETKKSVSELFCFLSPVNSDPFFTHIDVDSQAFCPEICARGLVSAQVFAQSGGSGHFPSINRRPPWYVLVEGTNLFETIILNCCGMYIPENRSKARAIWKNEGQSHDDNPSTIQGLTWQPKSFYLKPDVGGTCSYSGKKSSILIRKIANKSGTGMSTPKNWVDPNVAYKITTKDGIRSIAPVEEREIWRDYGAFLLLKEEIFETNRGKTQFKKPIIVEQFLKLTHEGFIQKRQLQIELYGLRTKQAKVFEWQYEKLPLNPLLTQYPFAGRLVQNALLLADDVSYAIGRFLRKAYPREGKHNKKAFDRLVKVTRQGFWSDLKIEFFEKFLQKLTELNPDKIEAETQLKTEWKTVLKKVAFEKFDKAIEPLDSDSDSLKRQTQVRDEFVKNLNILLYKQNGSTNPSKKKGGKKQDGSQKRKRTNSVLS